MSAREVRYYQDGYATLLKEVNIPEVDPDGTASGTGTGTGTGSGTGTGTGTGTGVLTLDADRTTDYVSQVKFMYSGGSMAMHYDYDRNGSIIQADEGTKKVRYKYDALGRLIREDNQPLDKTYIYEYSINGNITKVREYAYTVSETPSGGTTVNYTYSSNPSRTDRLTAVGGAGVTGYDAAGNPSGYKGASLSWFRGRMLQGYQKGGTAVSYTYDMNGIRRSKTVNGVQHTYFVDGTRIYSEKAGSQVYTYLYDASGITGIRTGGDCYYFLKTQQGDVKYIVSSSGVPQCEYVYDAWGNHRILSAAGEDITDNAQYANSISHINPFRYRGYYYDTETGFYYLNSRYYDPQVRRFINADDPSVPSGEQSTVFGGLNLYAYCLNNPVNYKERPVYSCASFTTDSVLPGTIGGVFVPIISLSSSGSSSLNSVLANGSFSNGLFFGEGTVTGLYASGHERAQISLKNGKFVLGVFGKFSLINATGKIGIGNDIFSVSLVGIGDIGTASGMTGILIDPDKDTFFVGIEAKAAVFTARGGLQFEFFDTQIEIGGSVNALSAGFQLGIGIKEGELYCKSGIALLFGYDFYIRIRFA